MKANHAIRTGMAALLCAALLAGCGGSGSASTAPAGSQAADTASSAASVAAPAAQDLQSVVDAILAANPISNPFTMADTTITLDIGLAEGSYVAYAGVKSNDNGDGGTVFVIQAASGQADAVADALEAYRDAQATQMANYPEFAAAQANLEDAVIATSGDIVVLAAASNECTDPAGLEAAVTAALA